MIRPRRSAALLVVLASLLVAGLAGAVMIARRDQPVPAVAASLKMLPANGLIAVSANPNMVGGGEVGDIYLVGEAAPARRIIGSEGDGVAQACPKFAPDGQRLAFGEARASEVPVTTFRGVWPVADRAIVVVGINQQGEASPPIVRVPLPTEEGEITWPKWSRTASRSHSGSGPNSGSPTPLPAIPRCFR